MTASSIERTGTYGETLGRNPRRSFQRDSGAYMRRRQDQNHVWMEERLYDILNRMIQGFICRCSKLKDSMDEGCSGNGSDVPP